MRGWFVGGDLHAEIGVEFGEADEKLDARIGLLGCFIEHYERFLRLFGLEEVKVEILVAGK